MQSNLREQFFQGCIHDCPQGERLPWWGIALRWVLFPLGTLYWWYSGRNGYCLNRHTWMIGGIEYSFHSLRLLATARDGQRFRVVRHGPLICVSLDPHKDEHDPTP